MIKQNRVEALLASMTGKRILVFGDIILDHYIFGRTERISPEAPVPVVKVEREEFRLGGAGNVAANIDYIGGGSILVGIVGNDDQADQFSVLKTEGLLVHREKEWRTICKTRVICQRQQVLRIDREDKAKISGQALEFFHSAIYSGPRVDGIIVSDYAKGTVTAQTVDLFKKHAQSLNVPLLIDPKPLHAKLYRGATAVTPNRREAEEITGVSLIGEENIVRALRLLKRRLKLSFSVITRGEEGISALSANGRVFHLPAFSHEVFDVSGAGDTVTAVLMLALTAGATLKEAISLANGAASLVVEKVGACQVTAGELQVRMRQIALGSR